MKQDPGLRTRHRGIFLQVFAPVVPNPVRVFPSLPNFPARLPGHCSSPLLPTLTRGGEVPSCAAAPGNRDLALGPSFLLAPLNWSLLSEVTMTAIQTGNDKGLNQSKGL